MTIHFLRLPALPSLLVPFAIVGLGVGVCLAAQPWLPVLSIALVFIVPVLVCAAAFGMHSGVLAAFLSFLAFNFFFVEPRYTFSVADPQELLVLVVFLMVAVFTGGLAGRMREQAIAARRRAETLQRLYEFSGELTAADTPRDILKVLIRQAAAAIRGDAVFVALKGGDAQVVVASADGQALDASGLTSAQRCLTQRSFQPAAAPGWTGSRYEFRPLLSGRGLIGAIGLAPHDGTRRVALEDEQGLEALLRHAGLAHDRLELKQETLAAQAQAEQERLRSALLSSISHDLRTPLATILGAVTSLRYFGRQLPEKAQDDLLAAIEEETRRLSEFVANLLAMTRLEAGINLRTDWVEIADVLRAAVDRARKAYPEQGFALEIAAALPLVRAEAGLLEQVIFNLLDNAVRYSPKERPIEISAHAGTTLTITVRDHGAGIPAADQGRIFDKFYTKAASAHHAAGTGLGLAIAKGVVEAVGGTIDVRSPVDSEGGTCFILNLPVPADVVSDAEETS